MELGSILFYTTYPNIRMPHNYSSKNKHVLQKLLHMQMEKITRQSNGGNISLVLHMVTIAKMTGW